MISLPSVAQKTYSHCGPAVLQLLFSYLQRKVTQDEIAEAAGVAHSIVRDGIRPLQLARAVEVLEPDLEFWFRQETSLDDLSRLLHDYHWPVAVNWQGLFYDTIEEQEQKQGLVNDDDGHYSVVIDIDIQAKTIMMRDPFPEYAATPRQIPLQWFETRWWDAVREEYLQTTRMIFLITPRDAHFPKLFGMKRASELDELHVRKTFANMLKKFFHLQSRWQ